MPLDLTKYCDFFNKKLVHLNLTNFIETNQLKNIFCIGEKGRKALQKMSNRPEIPNLEIPTLV